MCKICGQPDFIRCNCTVTQPFCDQCGGENDCDEIIDARCVYFHFNCDDNGGLPNLGIPCNTDLETILEALDDLVGNHFNIPFEGQETNTIRWAANGPAGHKPYAHVKISEDDGNIIEEREDGIYATAVPVVEFEEVTNDCITITVTQDEAGVFHITPTLDIECLLNKIRDEFSELFCEVIGDCDCGLPIENLTATFAAACPTGYQLDEEGENCIFEETTEPTLSETTTTACPTEYYQYSQYGAIVYTGGFDAAGRGVSGDVLNGILTDVANTDVVLITTAEVWRDDINDSMTNDPNYGPANRNALWDCSDPEFVGTLGFIVPIEVPTTKIYYVAIAADNEFSLDVDGVNVITTTGSTLYWNDGGAKFRYWHIYPINLTAGTHYIGISGTNVGGPAFFAAEIYDNTLVELQAAALDPAFTADRAGFPLTQSVYSNLNVIFTTRCARGGGSFTIGNATCPDNTWSLDSTGGDPLVPPCQGINSDPAEWVCRRTTTAAFTGYTATLVWDRIPSAVSYEVQQKLTGDPDINYVASVGSPVANPGVGTTVSLVISGLASDNMTFRVRAIFENCESEWFSVAADPAPCTPVSFTLDAELVEATEDVPYFNEITLSGTGPFALSGVTKPSWMTIQIIGNTLIISGTHNATATDEVVEFTVSNCDGAEQQTFAGTIDTIVANGFAGRISNNLLTHCSEGTTILYKDNNPAVLAPGDTIYTDAAMTTELTGFDYVSIVSQGNIFNVNDTTGVVGSDTGDAC